MFLLLSVLEFEGSTPHPLSPSAHLTALNPLPQGLTDHLRLPRTREGPGRLRAGQCLPPVMPVLLTACAFPVLPPMTL